MVLLRKCEKTVRSRHRHDTAPSLVRLELA